MTKTRNKRKITERLLSAIIAFVMIIAVVGFIRVEAVFGASTTPEITIDNGNKVRLYDIDGDYYYEIRTVEELYAYAAYVTQTQYEVYRTSVKAELMNNIIVNKDLLNEDGSLKADPETLRLWTPISCYDYSFMGFIDGQGYSISGLYCNSEGQDWEYTGFVGMLGKTDATTFGSVQNLTIKDSYFKGNSYVGTIGGSNLGMIKHVRAENVTVIGSTYVGGIVGMNGGFIEDTSTYTTGALIKNSFFNGRVSGKNNVGGIVGLSKPYATIEYSSCVGSVSGSGYVGGMTGYAHNSSRFNQSLTACTVSATATPFGAALGYCESVGSVDVDTVYYLSDGNATDTHTATIGKTSQEFASGEVAYLLNQAIGNDTFRQAIDASPSVKHTVPMPTGTTDYVVYQVTDCDGDGVAYSNFNRQKSHEGGVATCIAAPVCSRCSMRYGTTSYSNHLAEPTYSQDPNNVGKHKIYYSCCNRTATENHGGKATCTTIATCPICTLEYGTVDAHNHVEAPTSYEANSEDGATHLSYYPCCDKTYAEPHVGTTCLGEKACELCGEKHIDLNNHDDAVTEYSDGFCLICDGFETPPKDTEREGEPYVITNAGQLYWFAARVNKGYRDLEAYLGCDIVVNENLLNDDGTLRADPDTLRAWTPIGNITYNYYGVFLGEGHTVSGLYFNNDTKNYVGLFGYAYSYGGDSATIDGVGVIDSYFCGKYYVGAVVGSENVGISNCWADSTVIGNEYVGGVVGYTRSESDTEKLYNNGTVFGKTYVGGVCGYAMYEAKNYYNTGSVCGNYYVGGVVGGVSNGVDIFSCYNIGTVRGNKSVGGIVGSCNEISMENNYYLVGMARDRVGTVQNGIGIDGIGLSAADIDGVSGATIAEFRSGKVAYMLQSKLKEQTWGQDLLSPAGLPEFSDKNVYQITACDGVAVTYSNKEDATGLHADHTPADHVCDACGDTVSKCSYDANGFCNFCGQAEPCELVTLENYKAFGLSEDRIGFYAIKNTGNMFWFADLINNGDENTRYSKAVMVADVDLGGKDRPWTPIGTTSENSNNFRGHFDGNGKTITGLYVYGTKSGLGFFGEVRTGTVENFTIYGDVDVYGKHSYIGGVIGSAPGVTSDAPDHNGATIRNITSYVNVKLCPGVSTNAAGSHGASYVGGFIGYANHETLIENCAWYGTLDLDIYRAQSGVGGLLGAVYNNSSVTIRNCAAYGTIRTAYKSKTYSGFDTIYIGGIVSNSVASAKTTIENTLWAGTIINETNLGEKAYISAFGTLSGINKMENCYALENTAPYLSTNAENAEYITIINAERLASGEIAYVLGSAWGQTLFEDAAPALGDDRVYYNQLAGCTENTFEFGYSNEQKNAVLTHVDENTDHICDRECGKEDMNMDQHVDGDDNDHLCDYGCGQIADDGCHDVSTDEDHKCDECGTDNVTEHIDSATDDDHLCDNGCGSVLEVCVPNEDDGDCTTDVTCSVCGVVTTKGTEAHTGGNTTCEKKAECAACGKEYGELAAHTYVEGKCECGETDPNYTIGTEAPEPDNPEDSKDGLSNGVIAGIVIGSIVLLGGGGFALWWFVIKKKRF